MNAAAASTDDFDRRYAIVGARAMREVERRVIGCDYGATSYTTRAQADRLAATLGLGPGKRLLDIGSGAGWPGLYLARSTGCRVVLTDLPLEGLKAAMRRVDEEGIDGAAIAASGAALPLGAELFDAAVSSDVLC